MSVLDVVVQERHLRELEALLSRADGAEAAAYILFGQSLIGEDPWERRARRRLTSYAVVAIPSSSADSASATHITWSTDSFVRLSKRARDENLVAGIIHTHPQGPAHFSEQDDSNERDLLQLARNRNGPDTALLSLLWASQTEFLARLWEHPKQPTDAEVVSVVGQVLKFFPRDMPSRGLEAFARQALAFGPKLTAQLRRLRIAVIGCGGTGSATALLLARLGIGNLLLIDEDIVDVTNLNRLHGATQADADAMRPKVEVLAREIAGMALGTRVVARRAWVGDPKVREDLKSCDLIFSCTDDHDGRLLLNRLAYFYLVTVFDMGFAIEAAPGGGIRDVTGRVTLLAPGAPCLLCRQVIDVVTARDENLRRQQPQEYERRKREGYIRGGGEPAPAVVTFTTATACMAVDELLQALTQFRGSAGSVWQRVRRFDLMTDRRPGATPDPTCPVCADQTYWGRADVEPFLDRVG
jgi:hypothetical protein